MVAEICRTSTTRFEAIEKRSSNLCKGPLKTLAQCLTVQVQDTLHREANRKSAGFIMLGDSGVLNSKNRELSLKTLCIQLTAQIEKCIRNKHVH